ncbi:Protein phosphatase 2C 2, partial [Mortierella sp. AD031]
MSASPMGHLPCKDGESESTRILFAGGFVESGRVNGLLATSRALGDFAFKLTDTSAPGEQIVI